jgi:hypothetical protein
VGGIYGKLNLDSEDFRSQTSDHLSIVIVVDRRIVEGPVKATNIAPITILDVEGNSVAAGASGSTNQ